MYTVKILRGKLSEMEQTQKYLFCISFSSLVQQSLKGIKTKQNRVSPPRGRPLKIVEI